jgi:transcriptional regulator
MTKSLKDVMASVSPTRRKKIEKRSAELAEDYMTLQALRKKLNLTQAVIADGMKMKQANVSKVEKRSDMLVSTVRSYVEAMGGKLELIAHIPGQSPVKLEGFGDLSMERLADKK